MQKLWAKCFAFFTLSVVWLHLAFLFQIFQRWHYNGNIFLSTRKWFVFKYLYKHDITVCVCIVEESNINFTVLCLRKSLFWTNKRQIRHIYIYTLTANKENILPYFVVYLTNHASLNVNTFQFCRRFSYLIRYIFWF